MCVPGGSHREAESVLGMIPTEGGDKTQWRRKPRAGRRRPARNGNRPLPYKKKGGHRGPPFNILLTSRFYRPHSALPRLRHVLSVPTPDPPNHVPLLNHVDLVHARHDAAEYGVLRIEMRLG